MRNRYAATMKRIPMIDGDEQDALTKWRRYLHWRSGERSRIKRKYRRRERRMKTFTEQQITEACNHVCTCGGRGLDNGACPACEVWHLTVGGRSSLMIGEQNADTKRSTQTAGSQRSGRD